jgi:hypothetical protein
MPFCSCFGAPDVREEQGPSGVLSSKPGEQVSVDGAGQPASQYAHKQMDDAQEQVLLGASPASSATTRRALATTGGSSAPASAAQDGSSAAEGGEVSQEDSFVVQPAGGGAPVVMLAPAGPGSGHVPPTLPTPQPPPPAAANLSVAELAQEVHDLAFIGQGASGNVYKGGNGRCAAATKWERRYACCWLAPVLPIDAQRCQCARPVIASPSQGDGRVRWWRSSTL